jgi:DNA-binding transcriptional MerR regulator
MRISELAERSGVPATTLRFYETIGLVSADRTSAGYRGYDAGAVDRLHVITEAKRLGLTLDDIGGLLGTWTSGSCATTKADLRPSIDRPPARRPARDGHLDRPWRRGAGHARAPRHAAGQR